jgi:hypothetical protein
MRTLDRWKPDVALAERFSEWKIEVVAGMGAIERIIPVLRTVMVDMAAYEHDPDLMLAHVYSHLVLHEGVETYTEAREDEADDLADVMLDRPVADHPACVGTPRRTAHWHPVRPPWI